MLANIPYTFRVIRYVHDPSIGEMLNVGVMLHAPAADYLGFKFEPQTRRLSMTFVGFDEENFRHHITRIETALQRVAEDMQPNLRFSEHPQSMEAVTRLVFPDTGGSFQPGAVLAGITDDPTIELEILFNRMVTSTSNRNQAPA